jgi:hypothetical protein
MSTKTVNPIAAVRRPSRRGYGWQRAYRAAGFEIHFYENKNAVTGPSLAGVAFIGIHEGANRRMGEPRLFGWTHSEDEICSAEDNGPVTLFYDLTAYRK